MMSNPGNICNCLQIFLLGELPDLCPVNVASLKPLLISFLLDINTHINAPDQQTAKLVAFTENYSLPGD